MKVGMLFMLGVLISKFMIKQKKIIKDSIKYSDEMTAYKIWSCAFKRYEYSNILYTDYTNQAVISESYDYDGEVINQKFVSTGKKFRYYVLGALPLLDINNKLIYEGDIVEFNYKNEKYTGYVGKREVELPSFSGNKNPFDGYIWNYIFIEKEVYKKSNFDDLFEGRLIRIGNRKDNLGWSKKLQEKEDNWESIRGHCEGYVPIDIIYTCYESKYIYRLFDYEIIGNIFDNFDINDALDVKKYIKGNKFKLYAIDLLRSQWSDAF